MDREEKMEAEIFARFLTNNGFTVTAEGNGVFGNGWLGTIQTGKGELKVFFTQDGALISAQVRKPNGTKKNYYEMSTAKLLSNVMRTVKANA